MMGMLKGVSKMAMQGAETARQVYQAMAPIVFGNPKQPRDLISISPEQYKDRFSLRRHGSLVSIQDQSSGATKVVHILYFSQPQQTYYSFWRGEPTEEGERITEELFTIFERHTSLFQYFPGLIEKEKERLVRLIHEHQTWEPIHVAASANVPAFFQTIDSGRLNLARDRECGALPLHLAAEAGHAELVDILLALGADASLTDGQSRNALHYAAKGDRPDVVKAVATQKFQLEACLTGQNSSGQSPAQYAVQWQAANALEALFRAGLNPFRELTPAGETLLQVALAQGSQLKTVAVVKVLAREAPDLVLTPCSQTGATPLHQLPERDLLEALLEGLDGRGGGLCLKDKNGLTPLHLAASNGRLDAAIPLLSHSAAVDPPDPKDNTPLHYAASASGPMFQLLVLFRADPLIANAAGLTPRDLLLKKDKTLAASLDRIVGLAAAAAAQPPCPLAEYSQALSLSAAKERWRTAGDSERVNLLSLDGGGIKGLVLVQILSHIQRHLPPGQQDIMQHFNWIAGTSTGAILALALAKGFSLLKCQALYFRFKDAVFSGLMRPYDTAALERFLQKELGPDATMADIVGCQIVVTTTQADKTPMKLRLLRNYRLPLSDEENARLGFGRPSEQKQWRAARCSSAAPTYFASVDEKFIDGGLIANNPTLDLLSEVELVRAAGGLSDGRGLVAGCVLSVGTGVEPDREAGGELGAFERSLPSSISEAVMSLGIRNLGVAKNLGMTLVKQVCETDGRPVDRAAAWSSGSRLPFFRLSAPLSQEIGLDEKDDAKLVRMMWETELYCVAHFCPNSPTRPVSHLHGVSAMRKGPPSHSTTSAVFQIEILSSGVFICLTVPSVKM